MMQPPSVSARILSEGCCGTHGTLRNGSISLCIDANSGHVSNRDVIWIFTVTATVIATGLTVSALRTNRDSNRARV